MTRPMFQSLLHAYKIIYTVSFPNTIHMHFTIVLAGDLLYGLGPYDVKID